MADEAVQDPPAGTAPKSWLSIDEQSDFSLANLPLGIISTAADVRPRPAVAIGDYALDLRALFSAGGFAADPEIAQHGEAVFVAATTLNPLAALGQPFHRRLRSYLAQLLTSDTAHPDLLRDNAEIRRAALVPLAEVRNHLPLTIGDYTDFYAGKHHAFNVGTLFRGPANALQPNYLHLPVAYHGRASSVLLSGTPIRRPWGQILADAKDPILAPAKKLDLELEMGMFLCRGNELGQPISVDEANDYIFGYVLMNDWSARDIQAWEYVPLGPFNSKNLGTSISPWVVLADALDKAKGSGIANDTQLLPYLVGKSSETANVLHVDLTVDLITADGEKTTICKTNSRNLLWSWPQMIAHHTITGCNLRTGDLFGSGTISGTKSGELGSLLEQTGGGKVALSLGGAGAGQRLFLQDGDSILIRGRAGEPGSWVGFGPLSGVIQPALPLFPQD